MNLKFVDLTMKKSNWFMSYSSYSKSCISSRNLYKLYRKHYQVSQKTLLKDKCDYLAEKLFLGHPVFPKILTFVLSQIEIAIFH